MDHKKGSLWSKVIRAASLVRYRFFLFAGLFPYFAGQALAYHEHAAFNHLYFWLGFLGVILVLIGVELFNEYFDAKEGGDRVFSLEQVAIPKHYFPLGLLVFFLAFLIGIYFTVQVGFPIIIISFLGFIAAYFYVGPPFKWAYRGLGEIVIAVSYGPPHGCRKLLPPDIHHYFHFPLHFPLLRLIFVRTGNTQRDP